MRGTPERIVYYKPIKNARPQGRAKAGIYVASFVVSAGFRRPVLFSSGTTAVVISARSSNRTPGAKSAGYPSPVPGLLL